MQTGYIEMSKHKIKIDHFVKLCDSVQIQSVILSVFALISWASF